jgi:tripartite-type tricarboxylate transporter receptor subunit TctC
MDKATTLAAGAVLVAAALPAAAQPGYPSRPIRLVIAMAAGGATDIVIRTLAPRLSETLGQQIVVDNRPGANGIIGEEIVVKSAPDGYTLLATSVSMAFNPGLYKLSYDPVRDLAPITLVAQVPLLLTVHPSVPAASVKELVALAKAKPGQINYASFGNGSVAHFAGELFKQMTGTQMTHIAYKGTPQAVSDTIAGQTQVMFGGVSYMLPQVRAGKLRGIAVSSLTRAPQAPEIPTLDESGVKGFDIIAWFGLWAPAKTPEPVVNRLNAAVVKALGAPEVRAILDQQGNEAVGNSPAAFAKQVKADVEKYTALAKAAGMKVD